MGETKTDLGKVIDAGEQLKQGKPVGPGVRVPIKVYPLPERKGADGTKKQDHWYETTPPREDATKG